MLNKLSLKKKMVIISLVFTIVPMVLLELMFYNLIQSQTMKQYASLAESDCNQIADNYESELDKMEYRARLLTDFSPLRTYLESSFNTRSDEYEYYRDNVHPMLKANNRAESGTCVRVYHKNKKRDIFSFELSNELEHLENTLKKDGIVLDSAGQWIKADIKYNTYRPVLSYFLAVRKKIEPYDTEFVISVHINKESFNSLISSISKDTSLIYILDSDNNIIGSNDNSDGINDSDAITGIIQTIENDGKETVSIGNNDYLPCIRSVKGIRIIYLMNLMNVKKEIRSTTLLLVFAGILLLFIEALLMVKVATEMTAGINRLIKKMSNINKESIQFLAENATATDSKDEIAQLEAGFAAMMVRINDLVEKINIKELNLRDELIARQQAEINALQHQINPHYLFNTLEAIRMNLILKDDRKNAEIVKLFAESFRGYVDIRDEDPTLFEEVEFIKRYISIQNYRLNERIKLVINCKESNYRYKIAKLIIQPIIENAVYHGIEMIEGEGIITLDINDSDGMLHISVSDNGIGLTENELKHLNETMKNNVSEGSIGISNVFHRLKLIYGEKANMTIKSEYGHGTTVEIVIPSNQEGG